MFPSDTLPLSDTDMVPGSLATFMDAESVFSSETVRFEPCLQNCDSPEYLPAFRFDASTPWWRITEATLKACADLSVGKYPGNLSGLLVFGTAPEPLGT
jgi:hypothetical protein